MECKHHVQCIPVCHIRYSRTSISFYEPNKSDLVDMEEEDLTTAELIDEGLRVIREGVPLFKEEIKNKFKCDQMFLGEHGDYEYLAEFRGKDSLKDWIVSCDKDSREGKSTASLTVSNTNKALFHGYLNTDKPKEGRVKMTGYCNLRSPHNKKSFERVTSYDWGRYTHMFLRIRGDGRNYMLNIHMNNYFDVTWYDVYNYPLYTRGGPYWQIVKVPFTKFYLANSGRIQDYQTMMPLNKILFFSISLIDNIPGPYQLEIDYIALVKDANSEDIFEYELYRKNYFET